MRGFPRRQEFIPAGLKDERPTSNIERRILAEYLIQHSMLDVRCSMFIFQLKSQHHFSITT